MSKEFYVFVYIPTRNCVDSIEATVESVVNQTFDSRRLRIVAVDNCSEDGTYEKLLELTLKYRDMMSVYRLNEPTKTERVWRKTGQILQYIPKVDYTTILLPGNILKPECVERCTTLFQTMKYFEGGTLLCEVDLIDENGEKHFQKPIYTDNFIIKGGINETEFLINGIGHRIQPFYRGFSISTLTPLHIVTQMVDYNDWFNKFTGRSGDCLYIKEKLAYIKDRRSDNVMSDLVHKMVLLKRNFYAVEANERNIVGEDVVSKNNMKHSYRGLAILSLKYAIKELKSESTIAANDCLMFSEILFPDIINSNMFIDINNVIQGKANISCLAPYEKQEDSIEPPKGCFVF